MCVGVSGGAVGSEIFGGSVVLRAIRNYQVQLHIHGTNHVQFSETIVDIDDHLGLSGYARVVVVVG